MNRKPYTYRIGWTEQNIYYYGVRWANNQRAPEKDLWIKYFTSSPSIPKLREKYGEPDLIEVRKVFESKHDARDWEWRVMKRFVRGAPNYINYISGKNIS